MMQNVLVQPGTQTVEEIDEFMDSVYKDLYKSVSVFTYFILNYNFLYSLRKLLDFNPLSIWTEIRKFTCGYSKRTCIMSLPKKMTKGAQWYQRVNSSSNLLLPSRKSFPKSNSKPRGCGTAKWETSPNTLLNCASMETSQLKAFPPLLRRSRKSKIHRTSTQISIPITPGYACMQNATNTPFRSFSTPC